MKNLVIVESPAKAKTIEKFLGPDYKVMSSYGHVRDLKKKGMSVNVETDFSPVYEISPEKRDLVKQLKSEAAKADKVWLASDEDREGEAIAWHLYEVLGLKPENTKRIVFHEITKPAILHAIENPRDIDINRVNAQQARRVLDRIVGFELSPVLWKKIKPALSAGRVQSVTVRLICEREKEIQAFESTPFFRVNAVFTTPLRGIMKAELSKRIETESQARDFLQYCDKATFKVADVSLKPVKRSPAPPFTTSTLQQEAGKRLGFSVNQTMRVAQSLYEAGHITYMRTDSTNLSTLAISDIASQITSEFGKDYLEVRHYHTNSKGAQEAHEAIRPTYISHRTVSGTAQEQKLYDLIWKRAVASQMADARLEKTGVDIAVIPASKSAKAPVDDAVFKAEGEVVKFEGFMKVYGGSAKSELLPAVSHGDILLADEITATERFTQAPPRYNEESLVKKMEELGIGRPSTYASTISTIQAREFVKKGDKDGEPRNYDKLELHDGKITKSALTENSGGDKGRLVPTDVGMVVNDFLTESFPDILDYNFTAKIEGNLDEIATGELNWKDELSGFYNDFHPAIDKVNATRTEHKVGERVLGKDPVSGRPVSVKIGRYGPVVQMGDASDEEKPLFASLLKDQSVSSLTLGEALKLFELPRKVGEFEGEDVTAAIGKFGPYIKHGKVFVSIPKDLTPQGITLDEAIALIKGKREAEANRLIKAFDELPGAEVLNGRYGPYISYKEEGAAKARNYKIPKGSDPQSLTVEDVKAIMESADAAPAKPVRRRAASSKSRK